MHSNLQIFQFFNAFRRCRYDHNKASYQQFKIPKNRMNYFVIRFKSPQFSTFPTLCRWPPKLDFTVAGINRQICMNNNIIERMQQQESRAILEEEKDSDPIFKVIFNKLKFLRGKLAQINHIRTLDQKSLKPAQLHKLQKLPEIQQEIEKNQEFIRYYRTILTDHNLANQKTDDLLKLATLLSVGRHLHAQRYCPKEVRDLYQTFNSPLFGNGGEATAAQMSDEVIRVYHILWEYLENGKYYSQCRDYMTYLEDIKLKRIEEGSNFDSNLVFSSWEKPKVESANDSFDLSLASEVNLKLEKMEIRSEVFKIVFDSQLVTKKIEHSHSQESMSQSNLPAYRTDIDYKQERSTTNPEGNSENKSLDREPIDAITHPEIVWIQKSQSFEATDSYSVEKTDYDPAHDHKKKRNRKGRKTNYADIDNVRKISEAYTEPANDKPRKVKYVEKKLS